MSNSDDIPPEFEALEVEKSTGWKALLTLAVSACVVAVVVVLTFYLVAIVTHCPQLVYPPGVDPVAELRATGDMPSVNRTLLNRLVKAYEIDPCTVGKKYGALCQDGEVIYDGSEGACSDHGGVKQWIECR